MSRALHDRSLDEILAAVSRSFHLSLSAAPRAVRTQLASTYLVARAADTIADSALVHEGARLEILAALRAAVCEQTDGALFARRLHAALSDRGRGSMERLLLERIGDCLALVLAQPAADRARAACVLDLLIRGMERDLARFAPDGVDGTNGTSGPRAIATLEELDEHTYLAAGCVGEFWNELCAAHLPAAAHLANGAQRERAARLGKALQLVNVIRDAPVDLAAGRCYLPRTMLAAHGLAPADLLGPRRLEARPILDELRHVAIAHVDAAWPWVVAIPRRAARLRLVCIWPLWIALATLAKIAAADDPLAPRAPIKVHRKEIYRIVAESTAVVGFAAVLSRRHWHRRALASVREMGPVPSEFLLAGEPPPLD